MTVERVSAHDAVVGKVQQEDAVVVVRRGLERAANGQPRFLGEEEGTKAAVGTLENRLVALKKKGGAFAGVELSVYARQLAPGAGPMPMAS